MSELVQEACPGRGLQKAVVCDLGSIRKENVREPLLPTVAPEGGILDLRKLWANGFLNLAHA